jgi:hypothetical protein
MPVQLSAAWQVHQRTILVSMSETLSPDDSRVLIDLCRAGKLYDIEKWIAGGKSIRTSAQIKKTPLQACV